MLVPGCPPGLFTKQFAEVAPTSPASTTRVRPNRPARTAFKTYPHAHRVAATAPTPSAGPVVAQHPTYPYLVDKFFYTSASLRPTAPTPATTRASDQVGGPTGGGWFKMFEFFEVPSPAFGAIGPVAQGSNFDWYPPGHASRAC